MGKIERKSRFWGHLRAKLEKFIVKVYFAKDAELWGPIWLKSGVKLTRIESLIVSLGLNFINTRLRTKLKKALELESDFEIQQGQNCIK